MKLHNNNEAFLRLLRLVSDYYRIDPALVEKGLLCNFTFEGADRKSSKPFI